MLSGWGRVNHLLNAFQAEAIACLQGVQAACNLGIGRLILETDALKVKLALSTEENDLSLAGSIVEELKFIVSTSFVSFECILVPRNRNRAAHVLAAVGVGSSEGEEHLSCNTPDHPIRLIVLVIFIGHNIVFFSYNKTASSGL